MTDIEKYLAEEIATDFADGHIPRREALRRLTLLGVELGAAAALLSACSSDRPIDTPDADRTGEASPPISSPAASASSSSASPSSEPLPAGPPAEAIKFAGPEKRELQGAWAAAAKPRGGVLVIHENKGLTDHFRNMPLRFAAQGYSALAIDLLSVEGGTAALGDPASATAALAKAAPERHIADLRAGLDELARRTPGVKLAAIGFCFGGAMTWRLIATKDPRLAAAAPFYGPLPEGVDYAGVKTAVLGVYAEFDARVNASRDAAGEALGKAGLPHEIVTYLGADHAFFNETGKRHDPANAAKAWTKVMEWFGRYVG